MNLAAVMAQPRQIDPSQVTPGILGFVVFVALGLATWLLLRSMTKRLRNIKVPRDDGSAPSGDGGSAPSGDGGSTPRE